MRLIVKILMISVLPGVVSAQDVITPDLAVRSALQNHPLMKAATFEVDAKKYAEKAAFNLPNPEVNAESPTGTFYAVGVLQSFEFPTVYLRQKQVARAETALARAGQTVSENDLRYAVRSLYLELQTAESQGLQWAFRDSLYQAVFNAAERQFAAGEIDLLQKTIVANEAGNIHQERLAAEQLTSALRSQLMLLTGLTEFGKLLPLFADTAGLATLSGPLANPGLAYEKQTAQLAEQQIGLAKSKALPSFSLGYMNQGTRDTPIDYRFRASVGIPLWAGQYRVGINAARVDSEAANARAEAKSRALAMDNQRIGMEVRSALNLLRYYEQEALPRSRILIEASLRMREAGQIDYVTFLRTLDEAFAVQRDYVAQIEAFENARIQLLYLAGQ